MSNPKRFLRFNTATLVSVYVLILVGAIVRSLGAGMGCPDWPKCFGSYIPPSSVSGLPTDYEELFLEKRLEKNARLASTLDALSWDKLADQVRSDKRVGETQSFDATKAWIEYVNRIIGVLIGIFVFFNMIFSFAYRKENLWIPLLGLFILLLTVFQGWVGSLLVSTNLLPGFITFHMMLALLMVVLLLYQRLLVEMREPYMVLPALKWVLGIFFLLLLPQVITGTMTREQVDVLFAEGVGRADVGASLMGSFFVHRSYSWILLLMAVIAYILLRKNGLMTWSWVMLSMVLGEVLIGICLVYLAMPVFLQPIHLLLGTALFGAVFYLFLRLKMVKA
mgnify:CR=1 FL=1